jgi:hypothetical protein
LATCLHHLHSDLAFITQWLAAEDTVQQLTAFGYQPQDPQQQLTEAAEALLLLSTNLHSEGADLTVLAATQAQLHGAGMVLATFAIPYACNNPTCSNLDGISKAQLVDGRSCTTGCAGCRTARYCGSVRHGVSTSLCARVCRRQRQQQQWPWLMGLQVLQQF